MKIKASDFQNILSRCLEVTRGLGEPKVKVTVVCFFLYLGICSEKSTLQLRSLSASGIDYFPVII